MDKKNKTFIIRPDRRMLCGTIIALGVVVAWELFSNIILGKSNSPRWAYKGEAAAIGLMFLCMSRTCFYTFQKDRIVERFLGIPVSSYYYHRCSSCTVLSGFYESELLGKQTVLLLTFLPNRPFDYEKEKVMDYAKSVGKRGYYGAPNYVRIVIPADQISDCIETMKEFYPDLRVGSEIGS